jgi:hypothetical protein
VNAFVHEVRRLYPFVPDLGYDITRIPTRPRSGVVLTARDG